MLGGAPAQRLVEAGIRMDDAHVGESRLGQHARDVAVGERRLERRGIVELDDPRRLDGIDRRAKVAPARDHAAVTERRERLVDRPVIAPVENEHLRPAGDPPREADREPVGVGRGQGELPERQAEPARQLARRPRSRLRWGA